MELSNIPATRKGRVSTIAILGGAARDPRAPSHLLELEDEYTRAVTYGARIPAFAATPYDRLIVDLAYVEMAQRAAVAVGHQSNSTTSLSSIPSKANGAS